MDEMNVSDLGYEVIELTPMEELRKLHEWTLPALQKSIHAWAIRKEWRGPLATPRKIAEDFALIHSEVSEALEAYRDIPDPAAIWWTYDVQVDSVDGPIKFVHCSRAQLAILFHCEDNEELDAMIEELGLIPKPQGVGPEFADTLVRILDTCEEHGIDLLHCMKLVIAHNDQRAIRHGGKAL